MRGLTFLNFLLKWRYWIRPFVVAFYVVVIVILLPILIVNSYKNGFNKSNRGEIIGGLFVMMALPISLWQIIQHMVHYYKPFLQKHIIRVLWMVPIYALNAWLGLVFPSQSIYMNSLRECYEAYVIYNFMMYLLNYLNSETNLEASLELKPQVYHFFPLCCLPYWEMGREFVHMCKHGILQYTVVRPLTTAVSFLCELNGVYGEGEFRGDTAYPYMIFINNLSQFVAMYCLILFYKANKNELKPMKPVPKFLCIKAVVFFSFFQGVIISILVFTGVISSVFDTDSSDKVKIISSKLQNFLICIEMFLAAIAHHYSFSYKDYLPNNEDGSDARHNVGCWTAFTAMWDISDVHRDLREHIGVVGSSLSRTLRGQHGYKMLATENSSLLIPASNIEDSGPNKYYLSVTDQENSCYSSLSEPILSDEISNNISQVQDSSSKDVDKLLVEVEEAGNFSDEISNCPPDINLVDFAPEINFGPENQKSKT